MLIIKEFQTCNHTVGYLQRTQFRSNKSRLLLYTQKQHITANKYFRCGGFIHWAPVYAPHRCSAEPVAEQIALSGANHSGVRSQGPSHPLPRSTSTLGLLDEEAPNRAVMTVFLSLMLGNGLE